MIITLFIACVALCAGIWIGLWLGGLFADAPFIPDDNFMDGIDDAHRTFTGR